MSLWLTALVIAECLAWVNGCICEGKVIDDHCYEIHQSPTPNWISADKTCQSTGGHLAIFLNESHTELLIQYLKTFLTIPVLTGVVVANAQTQRLAAICPNNSYYGLIPKHLSQELVDSNFTNTDRCTFLGPPDFKLTFGDCNSMTSVLCDRPMMKKDYCNSLATCENGTTIGTTIGTTTMSTSTSTFMNASTSTNTNTSTSMPTTTNASTPTSTPATTSTNTHTSTVTQPTTTKTILVLTSMLSAIPMNQSRSTATPTTTSIVTTNSMANSTATVTTPLTNSTASNELSKTTVSFWDSTTPKNFTNLFDFGNLTTKPVITTTLLVLNGSINTTGVNGLTTTSSMTTTTTTINSTATPINSTITTTFNTTVNGATTTTTVFINNTTSTSTTTTTTSVTNSTLSGGRTANSTTTTTSVSGNRTMMTFPTTTVYVYESCRSDGVKIWGWCIPWWLLALLGLFLLLLLLLCCAFMWCLGQRTRAEERVVVPKMNIGVQTVEQNSMKSSPILVKEIEKVRPIDTDDKSTMTDFDRDVEIEERINEVEKVIYEPASNLQFPPQPISPKLIPQPDPIDIPINIEIHTRHFEDIYRTEYVKERLIVEAPTIQKADEELETLKVVDVTDTAVSPIPPPESTSALQPLGMEIYPIEWKFNNKLPKDMGVFDSDIDEPIEGNLSHRFVPTKKRHESPGKSKRKSRKERDFEILKTPKDIEQTHRFTPKTQLNVLKTSEMPLIKKQEKPKFGLQPIFQKSEPDVLKIGTPMSRDSNSREHPQRVPRGPFDPISKRPTPSNRPFRDDKMPRLGREAETRRSLDPPRRNRRQISPAGNMFSDISRSSNDLRFKNPDGRLGGVVGPEAKGWKPWTKQPKSFSDKPIFLDYD